MNWKSALVPPAITILEAIKRLDEGSGKTLFIVEDNNRLIGTVTDGDIRRGILAGVALDSPVSKVMWKSPRVARLNESREAMIAIMRSVGIRQIPVVDHDNHIVTIEALDELSAEQPPRPNWVVLMAGGLGTRLHPLTEKTPKPLLKVGNKPLLETIMEGFLKHNFRRFYVAVNYKAEMVKECFGDGTRLGSEIRYLEEDSRMGTAGALGLISENPGHPLIVMNGDLLTNVNFESLLDYHTEQGADATISVREYEFQVPFGVVQTDDHRVLSIDEKPINRFLVNGGIYVLNPEVLNLVPKGVHFDMTTLLDALLKADRKVVAFPIREYWLDIGRPDDLSRANMEFINVFD